jgi:exodeoxyribonuclease VII small subunit
LNSTQKPKSSSAKEDGKETISFENALARLEEILEKINSGAVSLEQSVRLYEEADKLIVLCNTQLTEAEQKVEILIKNRQGEVVLNSEQKPVIQEFSPPTKDSKGS